MGEHVYFSIERLCMQLICSSCLVLAIVQSSIIHQLCMVNEEVGLGRRGIRLVFLNKTRHQTQVYFWLQKFHSSDVRKSIVVRSEGPISPWPKMLWQTQCKGIMIMGVVYFACMLPLPNYCSWIGEFHIYIYIYIFRHAEILEKIIFSKE
jgi:hypothetical protein